ncbi:hypothetical protein MFIFM68171_08306 [Madurella fahalii]|uniref:Azaphilone pigments biosynthesis cluster protein L N-terminal domain-containing protein n=1 Tax=Madurella fahalii TaxID=1157608 RepID=A0ABQ0GK48_9PEZI
MDPVGAGASVLAFVVLALKSSNAIHQVLSTVKDGHEVLRHLVRDIAQLQGILKRLSCLQHGSVDEGDVKNLEMSASQCADDVKDIELKLQHLNIQPTGRRLGRLWKRLVAVVDEKGLIQMQSIVRGNLMMLNVHLGLLQAVQMSASQSQWSEILQGLDQLKEEVSTLRASSALPADARTVAPGAGGVSKSTEAQPIDSEFEQAISRLMGLIGEKEGAVASDDARQMLDDLQLLLQSAEREEEKAQYHHYGRCDERQDVSRDLKLVRRLLLSAPTMAFNGTRPSRVISLDPPGMVIRQNRKRKSIEISGGSHLAVSTNRRTRRRHDAFGHQDGDLETSTVEFIARVVFRPADQSSTLVISVNQAQLAAGSFLSIPNLSVHNIIPSDSPVFKLARQGKIGDILELVADGKASLQDRDERGWSLLHHSVNHSELCKLLSQHGLDVDEVVRDDYGTNEITPLHLAIRGNRVKATQTLLQAGADPTLDVSSSLPVVFGLVDDEDRYEHLQHIFHIAPHFVDPREQICGNTVFLASCRQIVGWSRRSRTLDPEINIRTLVLLLDNGGSVHDRDHNGSTCLHVLFSYFFDPLSQQDLRDSLIYISSGEGQTFTLKTGMERLSRTSPTPAAAERSIWDSTEETFGTPSWMRVAMIDFRALWNGREDRCPYWGNAHWSSPYDEDTYDKLEDLCHCGGSIWCDLNNEDFELRCSNDEPVEEDSGVEFDSAPPLDDEEDEGPDGSALGETTPSQPRVPESPQSRTTSPDSESELSHVFSSTINESNDHTFNEEAMHTHLWRSTVQYDDLLANPWLQGGS